MAIGVCYVGDDGCPVWHDTVLYLPQSFYESVRASVDAEPAYALLGRIMTMGYGGNTLIRDDRFPALLAELDGLESRIGSAPALNGLRTVVRGAHRDSKPLVFYGDMHPDLDRETRHSHPMVLCERCALEPKSPFWEICDCGYVRTV